VVPSAVGREGGNIVGSTEPVPMRLRKKKKVPCPLPGCTRKHGLGNCTMFRKMTLEQRLDMAHQKQLCLFCLRLPMGRECWTLNKKPSCAINSCGKLHEALKAGEHSTPAQAAVQTARLPAAAGEVPASVTHLKRELLEGLRIDPDTLEVRVRIRGSGELEKLPDGKSLAKAAVARVGGGRRLSGKLLEAFSLLCQAEKRFVSYIGESRHQGSETASPA
jgi:hypothetical protein